nr:hypothetical protein HK105_006150 [Polyrhizophydium stewartii]
MPPGPQMYLKHRKNFKNPTGRVLLAIGILDFFDAIAKFAGRWTLSDGPGSVLCQFQAFFLHFSNMSSAFLSLALALNALYLVAFDGSVDLILKLEWLVIAVSLLIPAVIAAIPLFWQPIAGVRMYGDAQLYCWIVSTYTQYQIYLLFMWLWAMIVFTFFVLFYLRYKFNKLDARMASNSSGPTKSSEMRKFVVRRMIAYLIAFVVIWTPSSVNRITQLVIGSPVYELNVFQAMFIPSRGLFDFLANYYAM